MKNPAFERLSLDHHENRQINSFQQFTVWCVFVAKGLSIHACRFGIEGPGRVGSGTSFGQSFSEKTTIQNYLILEGHIYLLPH